MVNDENPSYQAVESDVKPMKKSPSRQLLLAGVGAAVIILIVLGLLIGRSRRTIDLDKYIIFESTGAQGYGSVKASIDWDKIGEKYGRRLAFTKKAKTEFGGIVNFTTPMDALQQSVDISIDTSADGSLKNGDKVAYTWNIDKTITQYINCRLKFKNGNYKVKGLEKAVTFDAFKDLQVSFAGIDGDGYVQFDYSGDTLSVSDFTCDKQEGLKNGDEITVRLSNSDPSSYLNSYEKLPEAFEKTYKVEGLGKYLSSAEDLKKDALEPVKKQIDEAFKADVARNWDQAVSLEELNYLGNIILTGKEAAVKNQYGVAHSQLYMIYKFKAHVKYTDEDNTFDKEVEGYWYALYKNPVVSADGTITSDIIGFDSPGNNFRVESDSKSLFAKAWMFYGYETYDALYKDVVSSNMDMYTAEENVEK